MRGQNFAHLAHFSEIAQNLVLKFLRITGVRKNKSAQKLIFADFLFFVYISKFAFFKIFVTEKWLCFQFLPFKSEEYMPSICIPSRISTLLNCTKKKEINRETERRR